jgi:hypothetical protein
VSSIKEFLFDIYRFYYRITASLRAKPDFLIIGVQKGGTTSLFHYLRQHPKIKLPRNKEIHFFDRYFRKGILWYRSWFPLCLFNKGFTTGEATPSYMWDKETANRIKNILPDVKIIVLLRNPIDRAYSHYHMELKKKREVNTDFETAISKEIEFLQQGRSDYENAETSYLIRGLYAYQLERYYHFFGKKQVMIVQSEDLKTQPEIVLNQITDFLELPRWNGWKIIEKNVTQYNCALSEATRIKLQEIFSKHNKQLDAIVKEKPAR